LLKKHQEATTVDAEFASLSQDSAKETLHAASLAARCVPLAAADLELPEARRALLAEVYAKQAISLVREALTKGYRDREALGKDQSFDSLRGRPDFSSLLDGLVASTAGAGP